MLRTFETPNATMSTYASAALTGSDVAVWRVEMQPGSRGPLHAASREQVMVVLEGRLVATVGGRQTQLAPAESAILPAGAERQLENAADEPAVALVCSLPGGEATVAGKEPVPIPWAQ
jgi:quercetin dioxygenase-like cupin family protein